MFASLFHFCKPISCLSTCFMSIEHPDMTKQSLFWSLLLESFGFLYLKLSLEFQTEISDLCKEKFGAISMLQEKFAPCLRSIQTWSCFMSAENSDMAIQNFLSSFLLGMFNSLSQKGSVKDFRNSIVSSLQNYGTKCKFTKGNLTL